MFVAVFDVLNGVVCSIGLKSEVCTLPESSYFLIEVLTRCLLTTLYSLGERDTVQLTVLTI